MEFIKLFISEYGTTILYAVLTALAGYIGIVAKRLYTKYVNDKTKQAVAKTVVQAVEQIYKDLHGEEKLNKALEAASEMRYNTLTPAQKSEFNKAFEKEGSDNTEDTAEAAGGSK